MTDTLATDALDTTLAPAAATSSLTTPEPARTETTSSADAKPDATALPEWARRELHTARQDAARERERRRETETAAQARALELERQAQDLEARATNAERRALLTGRVADVELAMSVADRHISDGRLDVDALLTAHPALAPTRAATLPGAPSPAPAARPLTLDALENLTPDEINARWEDARAQLGRNRR